jgi:hypothetical protein
MPSWKIGTVMLWRKMHEAIDHQIEKKKEAIDHHSPWSSNATSWLQHGLNYRTKGEIILLNMST